MNDGLLLIGQCMVGALTLAGVVYTARQSGKATRRAQDVAEKSEVVKGYDQLVNQMRQQLDRLEPKVEQLERGREEDRQRMGRLERRLDDATRRYRAAIRHIRELRLFIAHHLPGAAVPNPPTDLMTDLDS